MEAMNTELQPLPASSKIYPAHIGSHVFFHHITHKTAVGFVGRVSSHHWQHLCVDCTTYCVACH